MKPWSHDTEHDLVVHTAASIKLYVMIYLLKCPNRRQAGRGDQ